MPNPLLLAALSLLAIPLPAIGETETTPPKTEADHAALHAFVHDTVAQNPGAQAAQAALKAAQAREQAAARPLYNPNLELAAQEGADASAYIGITQSIDWSDKRQARAGIATREREAAAARLRQVRQELALEALAAIAADETARSLATLAKRRATLLRQFAAATAKRHAAGDLSRSELHQARLALAQARLRQAEAELESLAARRALHAVTGSLAPPPPLPDALPDSPPAAPLHEAGMARVVGGLPDVQSLLAEIAAAAARAKLRKLETRPDPTIGARVGMEEQELLAGAQLSVPLFARNNFRAEAAAAEADTASLELAARDRYRRARAKLTVGPERYRLLKRVWNEWLQLGRETADAQVELLEKLWQAGEISAGDYLTRMGQALRAAQAAAELRDRLWRAWFDHLAANGAVYAWLDSFAAPAAGLAPYRPSLEPE